MTAEDPNCGQHTDTAASAVNGQTSMRGGEGERGSPSRTWRKVRDAQFSIKRAKLQRTRRREDTFGKAVWYPQKHVNRDSEASSEHSYAASSGARE